ncbi:hypothetical protein BHQ15_17890 [Mycolicibacillus koreensis]|nr:hypothetical protein BHQ15_17890 [Mycolicibacillus koreensis]
MFSVPALPVARRPAVRCPAPLRSVRPLAVHRACPFLPLLPLLLLLLLLFLLLPVLLSLPVVSALSRLSLVSQISVHLPH